jgi:hypothetical protein
LRWFLFVLMLAGLPLLGIIAFGRDPAPYLEIPPTTRFVRHAGFSWSWFVFFAVVDLLLIGSLLWAVRCGHERKPETTEPVAVAGNFPWWGWAGLALCLSPGSWPGSGSPGSGSFQPHTFLPIWAGFILAVNALAVKRSGSCLMLRRPLGFVLLFPASAAFWWFFEYLNRFVQNWYYTGIEGMGPGGVHLLFQPGLCHGAARRAQHDRPAAHRSPPWAGPGPLPADPSARFRWIPGNMPAAACLGLTLIGIFPDQLFALLWVSPLDHPPLHPAPDRAAHPALSTGMATGGRWCSGPGGADLRFFLGNVELFQPGPLDLHHPLRSTVHLFEMPILGYGGYLPFGLECLLAGTVGDRRSVRAGGSSPNTKEEEMSTIKRCLIVGLVFSVAAMILTVLTIPSGMAAEFKKEYKLQVNVGPRFIGAWVRPSLPTW